MVTHFLDWSDIEMAYGWMAFADRKIVPQRYPSAESEICTCRRRNNGESTLVYIPESSAYEGKGQCNIENVCAMLMIEKHKILIKHNIIVKKSKPVTLFDFAKRKEEEKNEYYY